MTDPDEPLELSLEPFRDEIDDVVELLEVVVDCWHDRADSYRRLECEREADQVELCASEIESLVLEQALDDYDPDVERGAGPIPDGAGGDREQDQQLVDEPDDQDGDDQDRPTCAYGACDEPAIEVYAIRSPTGPFDMPACSEHAPENKTPDDVLEHA